MAGIWQDRRATRKQKYGRWLASSGALARTLKIGLAETDDGSMFSLCADPPGLQEDELYHLCASLNAPVVNIEALPVGPARAAIVLHAEQSGAGSMVPQLSVGLRLIDTGHVVVFQYAGEVRKLSSASRALDVALSFAEAMGFLFDDDLVGGSGGPGRVRALAYWRKLIGSADSKWDSGSGFGEVVDAGNLDPQAADSHADVQPAPEIPDTPLASGSSARGGSPPSQSNPPPLQASPSRRHDDREPAGAGLEPDSPPGSSRLGRVPIVRMRVRAEPAPPDPNTDRDSRLRLLASF